MKPTTHGSEKTRQLILDALEHILLDKGFRGVGVNAVAREAGVDKVLIYRYFGSMKGLLAQFRERKSICPDIGGIFDEHPRDARLSHVMSQVVLTLFEAFRESNLIQEISCWELTENNPLTTSFVNGIERKQIDALAERGIHPDRKTILSMAIVVSGLNFITLRQRNKSPMLNLDFSDPDSIHEVEEAATEIIERYFAGRDEVPYVD